MNLQEMVLYHPDKDYRAWLVQNSTLYTNIDKETSVKFRDKYSSRIKSCYINCWSIGINEPQYQFYIGHVNCFGIPIGHSFLVKDNTVIDPTLAITEGDHDDRYGTEYYGMPIPVHDFFKLRKKAHWDDLIPNYLYRKQLGLTKNREGGESE